MSNSYISFVYDVARQGIDLNLFKLVTGTPTVVSSQMQINSAAIEGYADMERGSYTFRVTNPVAPAAGQAKKIGLFQIGTGAGAWFDIDGTVFSAKVADGEGNSANAVIPWDPTYTNAEIRLTIQWDAGVMTFKVNGNVACQITSPTANPRTTLSMYVENGNTDNLLLKSISANGIVNYI